MFHKQAVLGSTNRHDTLRMESDASNNDSTVACVLAAAGACLPDRCLATTNREIALTAEKLFEAVFSLR
jgi:hypothetical protein